MSASLVSVVTVTCDGPTGCALPRAVTALSVNAARDFLRGQEGWTSAVIDGVTRDYCRSCTKRAAAKAVA